MGSTPSTSKEQKLMKKQRQDEKLRLAQEKSDISEMKALNVSPKAGRKQLLRTSTQGLKNTLG
jgi:hypothetical protein